MGESDAGGKGDSGLEGRVIFTTLVPMSRLAARFGVPLRRIKQLSELAYYQEARRLGLRMKGIQSLMDIGFSKVGTLSRQLKAYHTAPEDDFGLQRRILLLLWSVPLTEKHLLAAFEDSEAEVVSRTLREMVSEGRLEVIAGRTERFGVSVNHNQLLQDGLLARLSALSSLMSNVTQAVEARFFGGGEEAFVRTLNFRVRAEDVPRLQAFYKEALFPLIRELDESVGPEGDSVPIKLSLVWVRDGDIENDNTRVRRAGGSARGKGEG